MKVFRGFDRIIRSVLERSNVSWFQLPRQFCVLARYRDGGWADIRRSNVNFWGSVGPRENERKWVGVAWNLWGQAKLWILFLAIWYLKKKNQWDKRLINIIKGDFLKAYLVWVRCTSLARSTNTRRAWLLTLYDNMFFSSNTAEHYRVDNLGLGPSFWHFGTILSMLGKTSQFICEQTPQYHLVTPEKGPARLSNSPRGIYTNIVWYRQNF